MTVSPMMGTPIAAAAYLIANGATRREAEQVVERVKSRKVPIDLTAALDILDTELVALRSEA